MVDQDVGVQDAHTMLSHACALSRHQLHRASGKRRNQARPRRFQVEQHFAKVSARQAANSRTHNFNGHTIGGSLPCKRPSRINPRAQIPGHLFQTTLNFIAVFKQPMADGFRITGKPLSPATHINEPFQGGVRRDAPRLERFQDAFAIGFDACTKPAVFPLLMIEIQGCHKRPTTTLLEVCQHTREKQHAISRFIGRMVAARANSSYSSRREQTVSFSVQVAACPAQCAG